MRDQLVAFLRGDREALSVADLTSALNAYNTVLKCGWPTVTDEGVLTTLQSLVSAGTARRDGQGWRYVYPKPVEQGLLF